MKRPIALAFFVLTALLAGAQAPTPEGPTPAAHASSIAGTVVEQPGSQPLKKALVQVVAEDQTRGANYTASTDGDGHFRIEHVMPGRYRIFIERTGFIGVNERGLQSEVNVFTVQAGQSLEDLFFRMMPTAVISGHITDEDGDPMSGVTVTAQKKRPGKPGREIVASVGTNDLGEYRLAGLFPGQYWIVAMPPPDFRDYESSQHQKLPTSTKKDDANQDTPPTDTRYLTTYYPGTNDAAQASAVTLKAADEMPINLTLAPSRTYRVRGVVSGVAAGQKATVELFSKSGDALRTSEVGPDGQFEVRGLASGAYSARVVMGTDSQPLSARQDVNVVASDVEGVKLAPQPSFTVSGHLHLDGNTAADLTQYTVNLRLAEVPEDPGFFMSQELGGIFGMNTPVDRLGNFDWKNVNPGNYIVRLFGGNGQNGFFLKSVTLGGRDATAEFNASGPMTLDLVVSPMGGTLEGTVMATEKVETEKDANTDSGQSPQPVPNATVVAVPEEKYRKLPDRFGNGATDQRGHFVIRGLAPGNYTLYAWQDVADDIERDPDFLRSQQANGMAVKVEEGSDQQVELKLSPTGEEWR